MLVNVEGMLEIHENLDNNLYPANAKDVSIGMLKTVLSGNELLEVLVSLSEEDAQAQNNWDRIGSMLAEKRQADLRAHFRPYREGGFFKIANPGEQGGGSFRPTTMSGREYWNLDRANVIQVGLSNEIYWLLKQIVKQNTQGLAVPRDVFRMLCIECIKAQS